MWTRRGGNKVFILGQMFHVIGRTLNGVVKCSHSYGFKWCWEILGTKSSGKKSILSQTFQPCVSSSEGEEPLSRQGSIHNSKFEKKWTFFSVCLQAQITLNMKKKSFKLLTLISPNLRRNYSMFYAIFVQFNF